ncbi:hypothetical protein SAMN05444161_2322 [Rhizobiales bacterium GAS191]|nr:hypothetical protein SAMN05444161_2322 [Rhizobiales bacterium GAS191]
MCECIGPGDNHHAGSGKRIEQGRYPLWTQFGRYRTIGYSEDTQLAGAPPMPGLRLEGTDKRDGILIHPGHPPSLYLSSIGCLNPTAPLTPDQTMNFWDSRDRVIALIGSLRGFAPAAFQHEVLTRIADAWVVVDGEPMTPVAAPAAPMMAEAALAAVAEPASLPISKAAALACAHWLVDNFGDALRTAVGGKAYAVKHLCGIVCQESAYKWLKWTAAQNAATIIARCVFDASGDYPGTSRSAFPKNTAAFRAKYGDTFTNMLINEANLTRRLQGWGDQSWVYKGYGIFQYDLQNVRGDRSFFEAKKWYSFSECLTRVCQELDIKLTESNGDLWQAIKSYNGSGAKAEQYMQNVKIFTQYCSEVTG